MIVEESGRECFPLFMFKFIGKNSNTNRLPFDSYSLSPSSLSFDTTSIQRCPEEVVDVVDVAEEEVEEEEALLGALHYHQWALVSQIFRIYPEKQLLCTPYVAWHVNPPLHN